MRLISAIVAATVCSTSAMAQQVSQADAKQAAATVSDAFAAAYNKGDPAGIAALFAKDGVYITPVATVLRDKADMAKAIGARIQAGWTKETINVVQAEPEGADVWALVSYDIMGTGAQDGKTIGGYAIQVLTREGADWRMKVLIGNLRPTQDTTGMATVPGSKTP